MSKFSFLQRDQQYAYHKWAFGALLLVTLVPAAVLNLFFLLSFAGSSLVRRTPHWLLLVLSSRDLLVTLTLIPIAVDWMVVNLARWGGGQVWCSLAGFLDFTLAALYPLLLVVLAVTLYTRNYFPPGLPEDEFDDPLGLPVDPLSGVMHTSSRSVWSPLLHQGSCHILTGLFFPLISGLLPWRTLSRIVLPPWSAPTPGTATATSPGSPPRRRGRRTTSHTRAVAASAAASAAAAAAAASVGERGSPSTWCPTGPVRSPDPLRAAWPLGG